MKLVIGFIAGVVLISAIFFAFTTTRNSIPLNSPTPTSVATLSPSATPSTTEDNEPANEAQTGTIEGKLCYPSEFLPAGSIEAKSTITQEVISQYYGGTAEGEANTFSIAVPAGNYILRYMTENNLAGYHTDVCPTGLETTCAADNERQHIGIVITPNQTVSGIDLCDFYYNDETEPLF